MYEYASELAYLKIESGLQSDKLGLGKDWDSASREGCLCCNAFIPGGFDILGRRSEFLTILLALSLCGSMSSQEA